MEEDKEEEVTEGGKGKSKLLWVLVAVILVVIGLGVVGRILAGAFFSRLTGGVVNVEKGGEKITLKGEGGELSFEEGSKLPQNFPTDFPVYPGAKLNGSWAAKGEKGEGISVVWETNDAVGKVEEYYKEELAKSSWKITTSFNSNDSSTISFEKEGKSGFLGMTKSGDKTTISVTLGTK